MSTTTFIIAVVTYVARYFIFKKIGRKGWEGLIPVYHNYVMFEVLYGSGWRFLLLLIPFYNIYLICRMNIDLAHKFGETTGFGWGLILFPVIFYCVLAFSNDIQCDNASYTVDFDAANPFKENKTRNAADEAEALMKFKELLDAGAISEEEYEAKKKEILGL